MTRATVRALVIIGVLAVWLGVGAFGGMAQGTLSQVQENDAAAFLPSSAESTRAAALAAEFSDETTLPALVVVTPGDEAQLDEQQRAAVAAFATKIPTVAIGSKTLSDYLTGPVIPVPSEDGAAELLVVSLDGTEANTLVDGDRVLTLAVQELRSLATTDLAGHELSSWVTGPGGSVADLVGAFAGIDGILLGVALLVVLVILFVIYRSPTLPFAVLLTAVFALCAAALVIKPLAASGTLTLNGQAQGILSILVVGAATDYSLLLVARYREELTHHEHPFRAMRAAWRATVLPVAASAGTVIAGLLCLMLSDLRSNASLGPVGAIGIASAFIAALTLLPALLLAGGRRARFVFWPRIPRPHPALAAGFSERRADDLGLWSRIARFVTAHARPVWIVTAVALLGLAAFLPTFQANGTSQSAVFLSKVDSVTGEEVLAKHFEVGQVQPTVVFVTANQSDAVVTAARSVHGVADATVVTADSAAAPGTRDASDAPPRVVRGLVQIEVTTVMASDSQEVLPVVSELRKSVRSVAPDAVVGGAAAQRLDTEATATHDLWTIIPVVLVVIFIMLVLLLRSIVAPLILVAANVLSFGATMGLSALVFNHVLGFPGADATVPLYGFVFLVALGIDYSIFLMTRVREEAVHHGTRTGVQRGLAVTGGVITSAGLVLAATFSALAVIPLLFLAQIAFIVAGGVLIDTLVVRTLLVPGVIHDIGRATWWPLPRAFPRD